MRRCIIYEIPRNCENINESLTSCSSCALGVHPFREFTLLARTGITLLACAKNSGRRCNSLVLFRKILNNDEENRSSLICASPGLPPAGMRHRHLPGSCETRTLILFSNLCVPFGTLRLSHLALGQHRQSRAGQLYLPHKSSKISST